MKAIIFNDKKLYMKYIIKMHLSNKDLNLIFFHGDYDLMYADEFRRKLRKYKMDPKNLIYIPRCKYLIIFKDKIDNDLTKIKIEEYGKL